MTTEKESSSILGLIASVIPDRFNHQPIALHEPCFEGTAAWDNVKECIDSGWVSSAGSWVTRFEDQLKSITGAKYAVAVSNGTDALRLALYIVGVRHDDEVLMSTLTFVATANAASHLGAVPHFVDIESQSYGISPIILRDYLSSIAEKCGDKVINKLSGRRIAALVPMHTFGLPSQITELNDICTEWGIPVVEDAAEALGATINGIHCGLIGDIGTLSFNGNKIVTTGGGGALITDNPELASLARHLSTTAKQSHPWNFYHDQVAWNDRLPNINAALGCAQLEQFPLILKRKRQLHAIYTDVFSSLDCCSLIHEQSDSSSNYWLNTLRIHGENAKSVRDSLLHLAHQNKVYLRPVWQLLHTLPMYQSAPRSTLYTAESEEQRLVNLPSSAHLAS